MLATGEALSLAKSNNGHRREVNLIMSTTIPTRRCLRFVALTAAAFSCAAVTFSPRHAQGAEPAEGRLVGGSVGHVQMGVAIFDRSGTLARETDERGFAPFGGGTLRLGFVHYLHAVTWLGFGAGVRGTFGNSASGSSEYFFNPIFTAATAAVRVPVGPRLGHLRLALDLGFTNILAKSRIERGDRVDIFHEYGIGPGVGLLAGYSHPVPALGSALSLSVQHSRHWVDVDVDGGSSKSWALGATCVLGGLEW